MNHRRSLLTGFVYLYLRREHSMNYSPYGFSPHPACLTTRLAYNGEHLHRSVSLYLFGNGHRAFSPKLMRFFSPDSCSPFLQGGLNCYCYCSADPINFKDPSGQMRVPLKRLKSNRIPSNYSGNPSRAEHEDLGRRIQYHTFQGEDAIAIAANENREARRFTNAAHLAQTSARQATNPASALEHLLAQVNNSQQARHHLQASADSIQRFKHEKYQVRRIRIEKRKLERNHKENLMHAGNGNFQTQATQTNNIIPAQNQNIIIRQHPER